VSDSIEYYQRHAEEYCTTTLNVDMSTHYARFQAYLPQGAKVLDVGCGSGRDSIHFIKSGFDVTATEPTPKLRQIATQNTGTVVHPYTFQTLPYRSQFDAIWCCASLLHVPLAEVGLSLHNLNLALKDNGVLYISVKQGEGEHTIAGRHFTFFNRDQFLQLAKTYGAFERVDDWQNEDANFTTNGTVWLNFLLLKTKGAE
jgi:SAM-dependent methyltransferase